uniref:guanylate cyclase n=1 Tax=Toxocara canis TaxID=6265 RepID=A0A183UJH8_TOXCA
LSQGLQAIHGSFLGCHGRLTSKCCLVNARWEVKISDFGIASVRTADERTNEDLLWTAPELLQEDAAVMGTPQGDVYSFAIICSEVVTRKAAWATCEVKNAEEIISLLRKESDSSFRPKLITNIELNPALLRLIQDCWFHDPNERPGVKAIRNAMKGMKTARSGDLMDHVFTLLERYADTLEEEVEARTKEVDEEKKRSDILLYRILPRQVAECLKAGQSVAPELFDSVTIFFSDVVSFTALASKCSPLQVINLLNDLYIVFDSIIDSHDVYKVETIGDGYMCVSGLPHRNGNEHGREIALMAMEILKSLKKFRIPHLPKEQINVRIGMHTGPCVAGVVGFSMPHYCLFGDCVNTASRMESSGMGINRLLCLISAGRIHLSPQMNHLLTDVLGEFRTESRGEIVVKVRYILNSSNRYWNAYL